MHRAFVILLLILAVAGPGASQESLYSVALTGTFTTTSHLFYNPDASDSYERSLNLLIENVFGGGIDVRRALGTSGVMIGLTVDYLRAVESFDIPLTPRISIPVRDGFEVVPVEGTGYFVIPFSSAKSLLYLGAGAGLYFGRRIYEKAGVSSESVAHRVGAGIHVLTGFEYRMSSSFGVRTEVKFRDVSFTATNVFPGTSIVYEGHLVDLGNRVNSSRLNVDGMELVAGIVYIF